MRRLTDALDNVVR